ncbi:MULTISPECIES: imidazole glycerol phosphate synthase subunit HisF [unclassified Campylobacter]|uniref:imidazole glycerol phosphate synthase subunit HisF n=1 Tax=unclassified Campylobacter TaxID=2593542 RepID=UPI001237BCCD|nr:MULTISPECIES: imidazole glycerol phosphate synthase subunit HisF [unclassified Campylobacter]KAA6226048.1 imidazole glycerol phosphate synthase subunit HisF [Campylobacter sp. LR196d]KAA6226641.1 imidazole glycerol phosphate synthase subunit HisF [Campylobacter sp. LR286c]KAA6227571.1 imidazole glycerol phosphate synthase subunit HisF [Campylobacter sp. LR185c]KAA6230011.1 imidazole glycerol phosphate synthase subunit HisF [Campylobacter sp. LR291e]KAA6230854.1 imidazole glycerol phosphate 
MLAKRIIACLDVRDGRVVKGTQFKNHEDMGDIIELAKFYSQNGIDELVFYDIAASARKERISRAWVEKVAINISIPFCVAGGIKSEDDARELLANGADKISINSPALNNPSLITSLAKSFGVQCVVVGIDSFKDKEGKLKVFQYTGDEKTSKHSGKNTLEWVKQVQDLGAGEIVLNMMNQDGMKNGYDLEQLQKVRKICKIPLIASGGAGNANHFLDAFKIGVDGALAASIFHKKLIDIKELKAYLKAENIIVRD